MLAGFKSQGLSSVMYDITMGGAVHDLLCNKGFMHAAALVLRLKPGGLLYGGVPCSSWVGPLVCAIVCLLLLHPRSGAAGG